MSKHHKYPTFHATGVVTVYQQGEYHPVIKIQASCYCSFRDEADRFLRNDAKWRLQQVGVSEQRIQELSFEDFGITALVAKDARGVRNAGDEPIEAFFDGEQTKKQDQLVRQRRVLPYDHADMVKMYGPKPAAPQEGGAV